MRWCAYASAAVWAVMIHKQHEKNGPKGNWEINEDFFLFLDFLILGRNCTSLEKIEHEKMKHEISSLCVVSM